VLHSFERERNGRQEAKQRFPVPFSMYRGPFADTGANAYWGDLGASSVLRVKGKTIGVLVCYEQFLAWPFLTLLSRRPDTMVAVANMWWSRETSLPCVQRRTVRAWAALFALPLFPSTNF
jgi:apolipoprotein N-acyltransferase